MDVEIEQAFRVSVESPWTALSVSLEGMGLEDDDSDEAADLLYRWDKMIGEFNSLYVDIGDHLNIERWSD